MVLIATMAATVVVAAMITKLPVVYAFLVAFLHEIPEAFLHEIPIPFYSCSSLLQVQYSTQTYFFVDGWYAFSVPSLVGMSHTSI